MIYNGGRSTGRCRRWSIVVEEAFELAAAPSGYALASQDPM